MKKVKIGNDIRLRIQISAKGVNWQFGDKFPAVFKSDASTGDSFEILSARAFFINTTLKNEFEKECKRVNKFFSRFPIEPFINEFEPDAYNIHVSGKFPKYRAHVANLYNGFGVYPDWNKCKPMKDMDITVYRSEIIRTKDPKVIIVDFPAEAQVFEGEYELLVQAKVFDPTYRNNERTVTASFKDLFKLVKDQDEAIDNPVQIDIVNTDDIDTLRDVYVVSANYNKDHINIRRNDMGVVDLDISPITQFYEGD